MAANTTEIRRRLADFDFTGLLVEELGWNRYRAAPLEILVDGIRYAFKPAAEKCGLVVYECSPGSDHEIPAYPLRRKIERQVARLTHEHLVIFVDAARKNQIWQWVRRHSGQPIRYRELPWRAGQTNESLVQVLPGIAFELEEEERLTIVDVASRVQQQVNERVTKKFYDRFRDEHKAFLKFIEGIKETADREWYASLMLNRLMFIYFIQKKGFLDDDRDYLRSRLRKMQQGLGKGHFHRFYRLFLLRLFHEGLGQPEADRSPELAALLGKVPYLNGGLFDVHEIERGNPEIQIPDAAFEKMFEFFDAYHWHLDERPLRADNEINPDVLGYIFEKYINQKQMGAYYTREDITGYISRNSVVPFLLEAARKQCPIAFVVDGGVWRLLRNDPDRYIHEALRKGIDFDLPADIAAGVTDTTKRAGWNRAANEEFALATETWREHVERRQHALGLRRKLSAGEVNSIDDLVTLNLDVERFALDAVSQSEGPELVRAFWSGLQQISVLDPTCGSGAFLFAALNILESLYSACLDSMQGFVDDLERTERKHHPNALKPFRDVLDQIAHHPNRRYFILKSIVVGNLYGVDIMEEAVEICKLRLFLKLVAQLDRPEHIEPLPDIDFNVRAGNTLVGFMSLEEVRETQAGKLGFAQDELKRIDEEAEIADRAFQQFRYQQTQQHLDAKAFSGEKQELRRRLTGLRAELDRYLAAEYGVQHDKNEAFSRWRAKNQPFHWFVEFYGIMRNGGFDVVIGNPPYLERNKLEGRYVPLGLQTLNCPDIYSWVLERSTVLRKPGGHLGFIVPVSIAAADAFEKLREVVLDRQMSVWISHFANRPGQLFSGAQNRLAIVLSSPSIKHPHLMSTRYHRWDAKGGERDALFARVRYADVSNLRTPFHNTCVKVGADLAVSILTKIAVNRSIAHYTVKQSAYPLYWIRVPGYFCQFFLEPPMARPEKGGAARPRGELNSIFFSSDRTRRLAYAVLNSSTYYFYFCATTDGRHINPSDVRLFPDSLDALTGELADELIDLSRKLDRVLRKQINYVRKSGLVIESFDNSVGKPVIDQIDSTLSKHYGFTEDEYQIIVNYDIKYRLGQDAENEASE